MITVPELDSVTDILDTDQVMVTNAAGQSYKIAGSELNKRNKIIIANGTTVTGAPLKTGNCVRIYFTVALSANDAVTVLQLNYNNVTYNVKVPKDGALQNYVAFEVSSGVFKYLQAYTTLELLFDGTQFVIIGNPVVFSNSDYVIYADGTVKYLFSLTVQLEALASGAYKTSGVNFPYKLPSTKYSVSFSEPSNNWGRIISVTNKNIDAISFGYSNFFGTSLNATTLTIYISY